MNIKFTSFSALLSGQVGKLFVPLQFMVGWRRLWKLLWIDWAIWKKIIAEHSWWANVHLFIVSSSFLIFCIFDNWKNLFHYRFQTKQWNHVVFDRLLWYFCTFFRHCWKGVQSMAGTVHRIFWIENSNCNGNGWKWARCDGEHSSGSRESNGRSSSRNMWVKG